MVPEHIQEAKNFKMWQVIHKTQERFCDVPKLTLVKKHGSYTCMAILRKFCWKYSHTVEFCKKHSLLVIAWVAVKFGINTTSVALKIGKIS